MEKLPGILKKKIVNALRSGKYKQGINDLFNAEKNTYCCLGVIGRVCGVPKEVMEGVSYFSVGESPAKYPVQFIDRHPKELKHHMSELMRMNDDRKPFPEIADYIEQNL